MSVNYKSLEEMNAVFRSKFSLARVYLQLQKVNIESVQPVCSLEAGLNELQELFKEVEDEIVLGRRTLRAMKSFLQNLKALNDKIDELDKNLPEEAKQQNIEKENQPILKSESNIITDDKGTKKKEAVKLKLVTNTELESVPDYMKGRIKLEQINKFVTDFNCAIEEKYKIMFMSRKAMKPPTLKKWQQLKAQETNETKGLFFCTAEDLKQYANIKVDKMANNIMTILRHCRRLKEIRGPGPIVRYTVLQ